MKATISAKSQKLCKSKLDDKGQVILASLMQCFLLFKAVKWVLEVHEIISFYFIYAFKVSGWARKEYIFLQTCK